MSGNIERIDAYRRSQSEQIRTDEIRSVQAGRSDDQFRTKIDQRLGHVR